MNEQSGGASGTTQIYTFAVLHDAAHFALHEARKSPEWLFYKCLHAIVSTAFCLEAYLNHTGPQLFDCWAALESLSPRSKLELVCSHLKIQPDFGVRPYQSFALVFKVRNLAAHGKTEILTFEKQLARDESGFPVRPRSALEAFCTLEMAGQLFEDCGSIITEIHRAAGREDQALWLTSHTQWTRTFTKNH